MPPPRASRAGAADRRRARALPRAEVARELGRDAVGERGLAEHVDRRRPRRAGVAEHQARLDGAVPAVRLEPDGGVDRLVRARGQALARAELHAARARAAGVQRERDVAALADRARVGEVRGRDEQRHRRVAVAERREPLELLGERRASARRRPRRRRSRTCGTRSSGASTSAACAANDSRNASTCVARDRQPGGGAVPAVAVEVAAARGQPAEQVERRDRAARPGALGAVERDQHRRPVVALGDPRGHDPDHARVPALGGEHVGRRRARARPPAPRRRTGSASRRRAARRSPRRARRRSRAPAPDPRSAAARARRRRGAAGRRR